MVSIESFSLFSGMDLPSRFSQGAAAPQCSLLAPRRESTSGCGWVQCAADSGLRGRLLRLERLQCVPVHVSGADDADERASPAPRLTS